MPKNITPQNQWETDFQVPLPGEPRNIRPLELLFQRLLNRTERLKNRVAEILGLPWDATPPDTLAGLTRRVSALETAQDAIRNAPTITPSPGDWLLGGRASGIGVGKLSIGPGVNRIPFHDKDGRGVELKGVRSVAHLAGEFSTTAGQGRWVRLLKITLDGNYQGARGEIWFGRAHDVRSLSSRLGYYVGSRTLPDSEARLALAPGLPASGESATGVITDAAIVQVGDDTYELWVQVYTDSYPLQVAWHHQGAVSNASKISYAPLQADSLPIPVSGGLTIQWSTLSSSSPSLGWFGRIVQSGSNPNGHYIRYDDGTQICWGTNAGMGPDPQTIIYPAAFASPPAVVVTPFDWPAIHISMDSQWGHGTTQQRFRKYYADGNVYTGPYSGFNFIAIGRWK